VTPKYYVIHNFLISPDQYRRLVDLNEINASDATALYTEDALREMLDSLDLYERKSE
jgi:hypothetical protein